MLEPDEGQAVESTGRVSSLRLRLACAVTSLVGAALAVALAASLTPAADQAAIPTVDGQAADPAPATVVGFEVTGGAAPGYIEERACMACHRQIAASYEEVGMARSFASSQMASQIEDVNAKPYFHQPSKRFYAMHRQDDGALTFRRWQVDADGREVNVIELDVDWVLGSGHTSRVYLVQTPDGELYQLPLAWYSQEQAWRMAPGFDKVDHEGLGRRVQRECMFCHNAYPDVAAGSDAPGQPHRFPTELPHGIGCQRCHGPGARHVELAFAGDLADGKLRQAIVNPGRLPAERRTEVCYGCHLQPAVELMGVRRFGRDDYSFRPHEPLADYFIAMDVVAEGEHRGDRFEINHHPYRLEQSACFDASNGQLSCLTCHDPHRKVPPAERAEHYRQACLSCHTSPALADLPAHRQLATSDCVSCHMPRRRTRDVVHVVMTDHKIQRHAGGPELVAAHAETRQTLIDVELWRPDDELDGPLAEVYRAIGVLRAGGGADAVDHLAQQLERLPTKPLAARMALLRGQLITGRWAEVIESAPTVYRESKSPLVAEWWALALAQSGAFDQAIRILRMGLEVDAERAELHFNLAVLLMRSDQPELPRAESHLRQAIALRPNLAIAWFYLGKSLDTTDRADEARSAFQRTLEIEPDHGRAYAELATLMRPQVSEAR